MAITEAFAGSEAVSTTEHSMTTDTAGPDLETSDGVFAIVIDTSDMVSGDELQIAKYEKAGAGDSQRRCWKSNLVGPQSENWECPAGILLHGWDFTLKAIAGTITVSWSIRKVA